MGIEPGLPRKRHGSSALELVVPLVVLGADAANGAAYYQQAATRSNQVMAWLQVVASPALVDGEIYLRGYRNLYCVAEK